MTTPLKIMQRRLSRDSVALTQVTYVNIWRGKNGAHDITGEICTSKAAAVDEVRLWQPDDWHYAFTFVWDADDDGNFQVSRIDEGQMLAMIRDAERLA